MLKRYIIVWMIFLGFFPKELIYRKTLARASKFKGKAKKEKLKANIFWHNFCDLKKKLFFREQNKSSGV